MSKFEKVKQALERETRDSNNYLTLSKNVDARHSGVYVTRNVITQSVGPLSFKTLNEVVAYYNLDIEKTI